MNNDNLKRYIIVYLGDSEQEEKIRQFVLEKFKEENYEVKVINLENDLKDDPPNCIVFDMDTVPTDRIKEYAEETGLRAIIPITKERIVTQEFAEQLSKEIFPESEERISPINIGPDEIGGNGNWNRFLNSTLYTRIVAHCELMQEEERGNIHALQIIIDNFYEVMGNDSPVTKQHSEMVGVFNRLLAREMKWDLDAIEMAEIIGILHDIGKANGRITEEVNIGEPTTGIQQDQINEHSAGADSLKEVLKDNELIGATLHHSKHTEIVNKIKKEYGKNNEGLTEDEYIQKHLEYYAYVSITRASDTFNAITANRGYNNPMNIITACLEMYKSATVPNKYGNIQQELHSVETLLILLAKQTRSLGYDLYAMINAIKENGEFKEYYEKAGYGEDIINGVLNTIDSHKDDIAVVYEAKEDQFCEAGFSLTPEGLLNYKNDDKKITIEKRIEAEGNKAIMNSVDWKIRKKAEKFEDILQLFSEEEKEHFYEEARRKIEIADRIAKQCIAIGYKKTFITPSDIDTRAEEDYKNFNNASVREMNRVLGHEFKENIPEIEAEK